MVLDNNSVDERNRENVILTWSYRWIYTTIEIILEIDLWINISNTSIYNYSFLRLFFQKNCMINIPKCNKLIFQYYFSACLHRLIVFHIDYNRFKRVRISNSFWCFLKLKFFRWHFLYCNQCKVMKNITLFRYFHNSESIICKEFFNSLDIHW